MSAWFFSPAMSSEPLLQTRGEDWELLSKSCFDFQKKDRNHDCEDPSPKEYVELKNEGAWRRTWIVRWGRRKVFDPFVVILRRGLEPKLLSLSTALGFTLGVFPICGVPVLLCAIAAVLLRSNCHVPTLMLTNFVVSPLELGLVVPFLRVGELVTGGEHFPLSSGGLWDAITGHGSHAVIFGLVHAVIGWAVFAPFLVAIFYVVFLPAFQYLIVKFAPDPLLQPQLPSHHHILVMKDNSLPKHASV